MAARTGRRVDGASSRWISKLRRVRRDGHTLRRVGTRPRCQEPQSQRIDLLVGQRSARALCEGGLCRTPHSLGDDLAKARSGGEREIDRIIEWARRAKAAVATVAARALLAVERVKVRDLRGCGFLLVPRPRSAGQEVAADQAQGEQHRHGD